MVIKDVVPKNKGGTQTVLGKVVGGKVKLLDQDYTIGNLAPKNKEQVFALDALLDDKIKVVVLTGKAGTGKTLLTLAAALNEIETKKNRKLLLSKPMSWVGKHGLGYLPGTQDEKFMPYLSNYLNNICWLVGGSEKRVDDLIEQYKIDFVPIQVMRGMSVHNAFMVIDEAQVLGSHEMVTIGTRVAEGSKLVILGDLAQRDEKIQKEKTGIYKFINHTLAKESDFVASLELLKSERGPVSELFANVFEAY